MKIQTRKKLFYANPKNFPNWPKKYKSRQAFGMNLNDFYYKDSPYYEYMYKDKYYRIDKVKAKKVAIFTNSSAAFPHSIPLEEWEVAEKPKVDYVLEDGVYKRI